MGLLVDGIWRDQWYDTKKSDGKFVRDQACFRNWITADGSAGLSGEAGFKAQAGRYHLYISHACPWAHRTIIFRALKGLEDIISVSVVNWYMAEDGWTFLPGKGVVADPINNAQFMHQVYTAAKPDMTGRVTVPVLWDKHQNTIVSNESSEIIRMFNSAFDEIGAKEGDYYPVHLRNEIDEINDRIYHTINNGVYKAGFATTQKAYEDSIVPLFDSLNWIDGILDQKSFLTGNTITEADWRLFTTLIRFDPVYVGHFKCNLKRIVDYKNLPAYVRKLYNMPSVASTVHMDHIKCHYYQSHKTINPTGVVPNGPDMDYVY